MLLHNFKYTFKTLFREKPLIFWTFAFPIILGTFFYMAFSNIEKAEYFDAIDIAVVDNEYFQMNAYIKESLALLGDEENDDRMFNIKYVTEEKAQKLLSDNDIDGYLISDEQGEKIVISKNGTNQTIFKSAIEEINQTADIVQKGMLMSDETLGMLQSESIMTDEAAHAQLMASIGEIVDRIAQKREVRLKNISKDNLSYTVIEFYTLIAMTCLYGGIIGMTAINQNLANMNSNGKRVAMSPTRKGTLVFSSLLAGYAVQIIGMILLFIFSIFILKVDFGDNLPLIILLALTGCLSGLAIGIAVGVLFKCKEGAKIGIILAISMIGSFFSGMMGVGIKYQIDKHLPLINKLNPAAMITDGFYSLYYYDTYERYIVNISSLLIFSAVMLIISWGGLRRQQYDSI